MPTTDFIREIQLRQWARRHFVPLESRRSTWHPIVLDEMCRRDLELTDEKREFRAVADTPLTAPSTIESARCGSPQHVSNDDSAIDTIGEADAADTADKRSQVGMPQSVIAGEDTSNAGSRIVPLFPGTWGMHSGNSNIPRPHWRVPIREINESFESDDAADYYSESSNYH